MIKNLRYLLHYGGMLSKTTDIANVRLNHVYKFIAVIFATTYASTTILDLVMRARTLEDISENCNLSVAGWQVCIKCFFFVFYAEKIRVILDDLDGLELNEGNKKIIKRAYYIRFASTTFSLIYYVINAILNGSGLPFKAWIPYDNKSSSLIFFISTTYLSVVILAMGLLSVCVENFVSVILVYIAELIDRLQEKISDIGSVASVQSKNVKHRFKACIIEHQNIYRMTEKLQPVISVMVGTHFLALTISVSLTAICIAAEANSGNLSNVANHTIFLLTLTVIGGTNYFLADRVSTKSFEVAYKMFGADWLEWPNELKKDSIFIAARAQRPIVFAIAGILDFSLATYLQMLKNCYSVFALVHDRI